MVVSHNTKTVQRYCFLKIDKKDKIGKCFWSPCWRFNQSINLIYIIQNAFWGYLEQTVKDYAALIATHLACATGYQDSVKGGARLGGFNLNVTLVWKFHRLVVLALFQLTTYISMSDI